MASFNIHLAIGKRYAEKNEIKDLKSFYNGIIDPDLVEDKNKSHYTGSRNKDDLLYYNQKKVQLHRFLMENELDSDYIKGTFLHLITDFLFFNDFFDINYLRKTTFEEFVKDLYFSYDYTNSYLIKKYDLNVSDFGNKLDINIKRVKFEKNLLSNERKAKNILEHEKLDEFIKKTSNINLEEYKNKILHHSKNVLP